MDGSIRFEGGGWFAHKVLKRGGGGVGMRRSFFALVICCRKSSVWQKKNGRCMVDGGVGERWGVRIWISEERACQDTTNIASKKHNNGTQEEGKTKSSMQHAG